MLLPARYSLSSPVNGVLKLAHGTATALEEYSDIDVVRLTPWVHASAQGIQLVHAFGGPNGFERGPSQSGLPWVLTPVHDSQQRPRAYRAAAWLGRLNDRISTVPGEKQRLYAEVSRITVLSNDERERIAKACGISREKISVVYAAASLPGPVTEADKHRVRTLYNLPDQFALSLCDYGARRKNILRLVRAMAGLGIPLVLAGNARRTADLEKIYRQSEKTSFIRFLDVMPSSDVPALMSMCRVYCQPSLEEGAGMAAMEASLYGVGVVSGNTGGAPEHLGPSATYVDPLNINSIRSGVIAEWERVDRGRTGEFVRRERTWANTIDQLVAAYRLASGD
jgi:glycosyltransferase involved in cell wall biosynthesis